MRLHQFQAAPIRPLGFNTDDKTLKRAGLDYWHLVDVRYYDSFEELQELYPQARLFFFSSKSDRPYTEVAYQPNDFLVFGRETRGLPDSLRAEYEASFRTIPMFAATRSLNLAMCVGIVTYEALRQIKHF